jgi:hypothetical protein
MISLYYRTENPYSLYGIHHFTEKFGIPITLNLPSQSGIVIAYGVESLGEFVIKIEENEIQNSLCGKCCTPNEKIPLCENPLDTGTADEVVAYFENGTTRYPCVSRTQQGITIGIDIFKETGYLLSGHLDSLRPSPDAASRQELASIPTVDFLENILFEAILAACSVRHIPLIQKSIWPEGKSFAVCLTHDVDEIKKTYQWISRPLRYLMKRDLSGFKAQVTLFFQKIRGIEPYYTYDDIISIEYDLGVKSTYYILKETGTLNVFLKKTWYLYGRNRSLESPEIRALIQKLQTNGDEVAIHGSYFSYLHPELLEEQTRELEGVIHENIVGSRQHNLNLDIPKTWEYQIMAGLLYDTSLGFKDTIGFRWGTSFPFFPGTKGIAIPILEIPLIIMDICLESCKNKEADCISIADEVEKYQGVLTLLWHPPIFNTLEYPDARDIYIKVNQYCKEKGAWITRARDIYEWLTLRNQLTFSCDFENSCCTIIPSATGNGQFFTLHLPSDTGGKILSENAEIIRKNGRYLYIRTHNHHTTEKIVVDFT